jgi:uncharacterized protein YneF (UPF0154 family)
MSQGEWMVIAFAWGVLAFIMGTLLGTFMKDKQ